MQSLSVDSNNMSEIDFVDRVLAEVRRAIILNSSGLLSEMALEVFSNPGKMLRSKIIFNLGRVFYVSQAQLVAWAATIELLHNATLVHDDLQDGDQIRRGQYTVWKKYGSAQAINVGDFFTLIALQPLLKSDVPAEVKMNLCSLFSSVSARLVNGQSYEPQLNNLDNPRDILENYFYCISQKTSALFSLTAEGTALLARVSPDFAKGVSDLFLFLGNAFQVQDDILDLYGDKQRDSIGCDIREGKVSILVAHHLSNYPEDFNVLKKILIKPRDLTSDEDVAYVIDLFLRKNTLGRALAHLDEIISDVKNHSLIEQLPELTLMVQRLTVKILKPIEHVKKRSSL